MIETVAPKVKADALAALFAGTFPGEFWNCQDDKCDCVYQRIGMWTNPYLAETLEVRMCCIWAELYKQFPQFVRVTPAYLDGNEKKWVSEPMEWNGETEMPRAIWYRQIAEKTGRPLSEVREEYRLKEPPQGVSKEWTWRHEYLRTLRSNGGTTGSRTGRTPADHTLAGGVKGGRVYPR